MLFDPDALNSYDLRLHTNSYLALAEAKDKLAPLKWLQSFVMQAPDIDFTNPITIATSVLQGGEVFTALETVRSERARMYTIPLGLPPGEWLKNPISDMMNNWSSNCSRDAYLVFLCAERGKGHFFHLPRPKYSPVTPGDFQTLDDDAVGITATSNVRVRELLLYFELKAELVQTGLTADLFAVTYAQDFCEGCDTPNTVGYYGGDDGDVTPEVEVLKTLNRFATGTSEETGLTAAGTITSIRNYKGTLIATFTDDGINLATATAGGAYVKKIGDTSWVSCKNAATGAALTTAFKTSFKGGGYWWLIGKGGAIWRSTDAVNYTELVQTVETGDLYDGVWDTGGNAAYIAGFDAAGSDDVALRITGDAVQDISARVGTGTTGLFSVAVLDKDHVMFGGAGGRMYELRDVSQGGNFKVVTNGFTGSIRRILGNKERVLAGAGTEIRERSNLTDRDFRKVTLEGGAVLSGNITDGAVGTPYTTELFAGLNDFTFVTDAGEIVVLHPFFTPAEQ